MRNLPFKQLSLKDKTIVLTSVINLAIPFLLIFMKSSILTVSTRVVNYNEVINGIGKKTDGSIELPFSYQSFNSGILIQIMTIVILLIAIYFSFYQPKKTGLFLITFGIIKVNDIVYYLLMIKISPYTLGYIYYIMDGGVSFKINYFIVPILLNLLFPFFILLEGIFLISKRDNFIITYENKYPLLKNIISLFIILELPVGLIGWLIASFSEGFSLLISKINWLFYVIFVPLMTVSFLIVYSLTQKISFSDSSRTNWDTIQSLTRKEIVIYSITTVTVLIASFFYTISFWRFFIKTVSLIKSPIEYESHELTIWFAAKIIFLLYYLPLLIGTVIFFLSKYHNNTKKVRKNRTVLKIVKLQQIFKNKSEQNRIKQTFLTLFVITIISFPIYIVATIPTMKQFRVYDYNETFVNNEIQVNNATLNSNMTIIFTLNVTSVQENLVSNEHISTLFNSILVDLNNNNFYDNLSYLYNISIISVDNPSAIEITNDYPTYSSVFINDSVMVTFSAIVNITLSGVLTFPCLLTNYQSQLNISVVSEQFTLTSAV